MGVKSHGVFLGVGGGGLYNKKFHRKKKKKLEQVYRTRFYEFLFFFLRCEWDLKASSFRIIFSQL